MITLKNVSFAYPSSDQSVIKNVSLEIQDGQYVAIIGPNGSGKSTFAKLLNALLLPTIGQVTVEDVDTKEDKWLVRKMVGMVFQNPENQLIASTAEEEIAFGMENLGMDSTKMKEIVPKTLEIIGLEEKRYSPPSSLSGGQKQRLAIGAVLAMEPRYIILDEATSMLDELGRSEILETIEGLNRNYHLGIIHITHDMFEAVRADRIILMSKGQVMIDGTPKEILSNPQNLLELGSKLPGVTRIAYNLRAKGIPIDSGITSGEELVKQLCLLNSRM